MEISNRVHLLASGRLGCSMSHPGDCNVYALRCGSSYFLIDTGIGIEPDRILQEMEHDHIEPAHVSGILLTHGHLDHSGGAAALQRSLSIPLYASEQTAKALRTGDEDAISLAAAKQAGLYAAELHLQPCPVDFVLQDGCEIEAGDCKLTAVHTPGHSGDHFSFVADTPDGTLLFPGDTVFHGGRIQLQATWDCDVVAHAASLRRLAKYTVAGLYPGHGLWCVSEGSSHIEKSLWYLDRLLLPPDLITGAV